MYCTGRGSAAHVLQDGLRNKYLGFHSLPQDICVCCVPLPALNAHAHRQGSYLGLACTHTHTHLYAADAKGDSSSQEC